MTNPANTSPTSQADRQAWMSVLARATPDAIAALLPAPLPAFTLLRPPEVGMVMTRGRAGGTGARFNLGEMTVTRCTVRNEAGQIGHAYIAGRAPEHATLAARLDAALQDPATHAALAAAVIAPLARAQAEAREHKARQAAATRVDFFTLATMRSS